MFNKGKEFKYSVDPNFDFVLEERANTYIALRKIKWGENGDPKIDIRKYVATEEGERMMKGCSMSDDGANELAKVLVQQGYGKDKDIFNSIIDNRPEITSRFIREIKESSDSAIEEHLKKYPIVDVEEDDEELFNLNEIV